MRKLAALSGRKLFGWSCTSLEQGDEARGDLMRTQSDWEGGKTSCEDINKTLGKSVLGTREVFVFLAKIGNIDLECFLEAAISGSSLIGDLEAEGVKVPPNLKARYPKSSTTNKRPLIPSPTPPTKRRSVEIEVVHTDARNDSGFSTDDVEDVSSPDYKLQLCKEKEKNLILQNELTALKVSHEKKIAVLDGRLNKALRGSVYGDMSSEAVLMLLEKKLKGKVIIEEKDYMRWKQHINQKRLKSTILDIQAEVELGVSELNKIYNEIE